MCCESLNVILIFRVFAGWGGGGLGGVLGKPVLSPISDLGNIHSPVLSNLHSSSSHNEKGTSVQ